MSLTVADRIVDCEICWTQRELPAIAPRVARMAITEPSAALARLTANTPFTVGSYMRIAAFFGAIAAAGWLSSRSKG
ncbi:MAG: hypothetical protein HYT77_09905 [Deltaproteobacteria bacterium]|nr:hypothetical protein [Deltaproteobacteria bacterium]